MLTYGYCFGVELTVENIIVSGVCAQAGDAVSASGL
jgi:hypothetical protein